MRGARLQHLEIPCVNKVKKAYRSVTGLDRIHQYQIIEADHEIQQSEAHLGTFENGDVLAVGQTFSSGVNDPKTDGIVTQQVIAQAEQKDFSSRGNRNGLHIQRPHFWIRLGRGN
jgi:hypothetical protein